MSSRQTTLLGISRRIVSLTLDLRGIARVVADARVTMLLPVRLPLGAERRGKSRRRQDDEYEHPSRLPRSPPCAPSAARRAREECGALLASGERRGRYLKGSFTTTLTPAITPVTALWTRPTASWLISPAPLRAPVAAAAAASSAPRPTLLAVATAPSTAFRATSPTSPPTSAALLTRTRALVLIVPTASAPTSFVPLRTPMTPPLAVAPRSPPTWAGPVMAPRKTSETVEVSAVPTAPVPLMVLTSVPLTVSTTVVKISPVPLIEPTNVSFTDSMIPLRTGVLIWDLLPATNATCSHPRGSGTPRPARD